MMNNKVENLKGLILGNVSIGIDLVKEVNSWDGSLDYLEVFSMDDLDDILNGFTPLEIANRIFYGDFNPNDDFFRFNGYDNLESLNEYDLKDEIKDYALEIARRTIELYEEGNLDWLDYLGDELIKILDEEEEE